MSIKVGKTNEHSLFPQNNWEKVWNLLGEPLSLHRVFHSIRFKVNKVGIQWYPIFFTLLLLEGDKISVLMKFFTRAFPSSLCGSTHPLCLLHFIPQRTLIFPHFPPLFCSTHSVRLCDGRLHLCST